MEIFPSVNNKDEHMNDGRGSVHLLASLRSTKSTVIILSQRTEKTARCAENAQLVFNVHSPE